MPERTRPLRILSLDGGGVLGLATASFLASAEDHFGQRFADRFDVFCGTSTGSIIALGLASGMSASEVVETYKVLGPSVFRNRWTWVRHLRMIRGLWSSKYGNEALRKALRDQFGDTTLGSLKARGKMVIVPAYCITTGQPRVFKTNHSANLTEHDEYLVRDVALASASAPFYLPPAAIARPRGGGEELFVDGGVFANDPALLAYAEALHFLNRPPAEVQLLTVSTPRGDLAEPHAAVKAAGPSLFRRGLFQWGSKLATLFIDSTSLIHATTLRFLATSEHGRLSAFERFRLSTREGLEMDIATPKALNTLQNLGWHEGSLNQTRSRLSPFFEVGHGERSEAV